MNRKRKDRTHSKLQIQLVLSQLAVARRELRETLRAFEAHLEIALAEVVQEIAALKATKQLSRNQLDLIDNLVGLLRRRKLKPEKGRRKDLRRIEELIRDLHAVTRPR
jgi:hypothetical protein